MLQLLDSTTGSSLWEWPRLAFDRRIRSAKERWRELRGIPGVRSAIAFGRGARSFARLLKLLVLRVASDPWHNRQIPSCATANEPGSEPASRRGQRSDRPRRERQRKELRHCSGGHRRKEPHDRRAELGGNYRAPSATPCHPRGG